jgi:uncharacterized membrane protein YphA (DoxX/SURF4 family)
MALFNNMNGWHEGKAYERQDGRIMSIFVGILDLQLILGMIILFTGEMTQSAIVHSVVLILTITFAHIHIRWRDKEDTAKFRNNTLLIGLIMVLIIVGVFALPQGWFG